MDEVSQIYQKYYKLNMVIEILQETGLVDCFQTDFSAENIIENLLYILCNNTYSNKYVLYRRKNEERLSITEFLGVRTDILGLNKLIVLETISNHSDLEIGDIILRINDHSPLSYFDIKVIDKLNLNILRYNSNRKTYENKNIVINNKNIELFDFENQYNLSCNYLRVNSFDNLVGIKHFLKNSKKEITLDFRNNLGGPIEKTVGFLGFLLPKDTVICYEKKKNVMNPILINTDKIFYYDKINILVNELTASAAEIAVLALQKNLDVEVIGTTTHTFGKECIQNYYNFDDKSCLGAPVSLIYTPDKVPMDQNSIRIDKLLSNEDIDYLYIKKNKEGG